jgi:hypothetical protein
VVRRYALLFCLLLFPAVGHAQNAAPILPTGDAAVAGFSGTIILGSPPPPEPKRIDKTYIDLDGPSLRVIGLARMGGPPQAQLVAAPKPFTATARQLGQVFSLALDDANPPNIYAAASSAYGLPIVVPDADGDGVPDRARRGAPNAAFMPGLFGPITADGGPGSIWKINGSTGAVTLFANVTLGGVPNSGPALGGLAFDPASRQLFVADRDTGLIHRFTRDGVERGRFDHGSQALSAAGLPPIGFDPRKRLNIESPAFDTANPATWAYAPPARRVFGMAVSRGRLYYAVAAGLRIWSVSLLPDGSFGSDARGEVSVPRGALPNSEVSEILFDDNGDMLVAERGAPTGAYDYKALAESPENRVLRFRPKNPDDPPSRDLWFPVPKEYAIGFPPTLRNDNGGIAIGYGYDPAGNINRAVCGGTLWSTGEQLRNARDRAIIQRLQAGGPLIVDGLQGNSTRLLRPLNEPPFETYFIDYDDRFDDSQTRGYLGDVVIWRTCGQATLLPVVPVVLVCPPGLFDVDGACRFPPTCPSGTEFSNGCCTYRGCPASYVRINGKCAPPPMNCGEGETYSEGACQAPRCPAGLVPVKRSASRNGLPTATNAQLPRPPDAPQRESDCGPGEVFTNDQCQPGPPDGGRPKMCSGGTYCACPDGSKPNADGTCNQSNSCGLHMVPATGAAAGECVCDVGYQGTVVNGSYVCIPGDQNPTPKLKVTKTLLDCCSWAPDGASPSIACRFYITIQNIGTVPFSGPLTLRDVDPNSQPPLDISGTRFADLQPGETQPLGGLAPKYSPGTRYSNCFAIGTRPPSISASPGPDISCASGVVPATAPSCYPETVYSQPRFTPPTITIPLCPGGMPRNSDGNCPTPPTITVTCPEGAKIGLNGQCFFGDPGCQGPNCGQVNTSCPAYKSDGTCCNAREYQTGQCGGTQACTGGKTFNDGACRCPYPSTENSAGNCVKSETKELKRTSKKPRKPTTKPNSDNPAPSGPQFNIQIGPGFPGGGHPGGGKPGGGMPKTGGGCGARCG